MKAAGRFSISKLSFAGWGFFCLALVAMGLGSARAETADSCAIYRHPLQKTAVAHWIVERQAPDVGDPPDVAAHIAASRADRKGGSMSCLVIQCAGRETSVYFELAPELAGKNHGTAIVSYKTAGGTEAKRSFGRSNDRLAVGLWQSAAAAAFVKDIADGKTLSVKAKLAAFFAVKGEFAIDGIGRAIAPVRAACHW